MRAGLRNGSPGVAVSHRLHQHATQTPRKAEKGVIVRVGSLYIGGMSGFGTMNVKKPETAGTSKIQRPARKAIKAASAPRADSSGRTPPTELAKWIEKARSLPEVRQDLVERVKAKIAAGDYETPEKIQIATERLLEEF